MRIEWIVKEVSWPKDAAAIVSALASDGETAWLDSAASRDPASQDARYSLICRDPIGVLEQYEGEAARFVVQGREIATGRNGWDLWGAVHRSIPRTSRLDLGLSPGWVGYVGFEMSRQLERLPGTNRNDMGLPALRMGLYDRGVVLDHQEHRAYAMAANGLRSMWGASESSLSELIEAWEASAGVAEASGGADAPRLVFEMDRDYYRWMIRKALGYIAAGDIYQVNLAQRLRFDRAGDPFAAYCRMRRTNPAPYAAFLHWPGGAIGSLSPELFLRQRGRDVLTSPIKGTRPRTHDEIVDAAYRQELLDSEKDAAELAMIIDLHRNDIGRVCEFGGVRVRDPRRIEAHPTVYHTVADIAGRLREEYDGLDLLKACFPAGSISGAPKIRAIEIIDELEPAARGAYSGAVGVLGLDGQMTFNVAIRTVQFYGDSAAAYVGGGIVADSDPEEEYEETLAKALGIMRGMRPETAVTAGSIAGADARELFIIP